MADPDIRHGGGDQFIVSQYFFVGNRPKSIANWMGSLPDLPMDLPRACFNVQ